MCGEGLRGEQVPPTRLAFFYEHHRPSLWFIQVCCNLGDPNEAVLAPTPTQVLPYDLAESLDILDDLRGLIMALLTHRQQLIVQVAQRRVDYLAMFTAIG